MKTALDTNILSALLSREPSALRIAAELDHIKKSGSLVVSPVVYAECLAHPLHAEAYVESFLSDTEILIELVLKNDLWSNAGRRYRQYAIRRRQSGGDSPRRLLADFVIGTHALLQADQLITLDQRFYRTYFPELRLYPIQA